MNQTPPNQGDLFTEPSGNNTLDGLAREKISNAPGTIVAWILMASYLYYHHDESIISDALYDELCRTLQNNYGDIQHRHKGIISLAHLEAGSVFDLTINEYPTLVRDAAAALLYDHFGTDLGGQFAREESIQARLEEFLS